jgi:hypothetical protein
MIAAAGVLSALVGGAEARTMTASMAITSSIANPSEDGLRLAAAVFLPAMTPTKAIVAAGAASGAEADPDLQVLRSGLYPYGGSATPDPSALDVYHRDGPTSPVGPVVPVSPLFSLRFR